MSKDTLKQLSQEKNPSSECREFFDQKWQLYQKVLACNYMQHREAYEIVSSLLQNSKKANFNFLDLGCGDASFITQALQKTNIEGYVGLDISETAISIARENISSKLNCEYEFIRGNLLEILPKISNTQDSKYQFDYVFSSFAFHHFDIQQKDYLLDVMQSLLKPGGVFILVDFFRDNNQSREECIKEYLTMVGQSWRELKNDEQELIAQHMWSSDRPESLATMEQLGKKNGFKLGKYLDLAKSRGKICYFTCC